MWNYGSSAEALEDVLRLSKGMSYKNAMAGLPAGGGKAVILADAERTKTPKMLAAFARAVSGVRILGAVVPVGGVLLIAGWTLLALAGMRLQDG
jgi:glutamate dehydrogenase/leucine dehydrogenase